MEEHMDYFRPIMAGWVHLTQDELDRQSPVQLRRLNAAIELKAEWEKEQYEKSK